MGPVPIWRGRVDLRNLPADYEDPAEFLANLKLDLYEDLVFVLTPQGM